MALTNETAMMAETTVEDDKKPKKKAKIRQKKSTATTDAQPQATALTATGAIGQAAQQKQEKKIPRVTEYFNEKIPGVEDSLNKIGFSALNIMGRDKTGPIKYESGMGSGETDYMGNPKTTKGGGLSIAYSKGVNNIMDQLEKAGVNTIDQARTTLTEWFKPENRVNNLGKDNIFNTSEWQQLGKQNVRGDYSYEKDLIEKVSSAYANLKKERDQRYGVTPGQTAEAAKEIKPAQAISVMRQ